MGVGWLMRRRERGLRSARSYQPGTGAKYTADADDHVDAAPVHVQARLRAVCAVVT